MKIRNMMQKYTFFIILQYNHVFVYLAYTYKQMVIALSLTSLVFMLLKISYRRFLFSKRYSHKGIR